MTQAINDSEFEQEVVQSDKAVLIDFWAEWCGPCKMLSPVLDQISEEIGNKIKVVKMNIDDNPHTPSALSIRSIPTLMIFKNGKQVDVKVGAHTKAHLIEWINSVI